MSEKVSPFIYVSKVFSPRAGSTLLRLSRFHENSFHCAVLADIIALP